MNCIGSVPLDALRKNSALTGWLPLLPREAQDRGPSAAAGPASGDRRGCWTRAWRRCSRRRRSGRYVRTVVLGAHARQGSGAARSAGEHRRARRGGWSMRTHGPWRSSAWPTTAAAGPARARPRSPGSRCSAPRSRSCAGSSATTCGDRMTHARVRRAVHAVTAARAARARLRELAESSLLTQPSLSRLVERLEVDGLVTRGPVEGDGRGVAVTLTDAGAAAAARGRSSARALDRRTSSGGALDADELATLGAMQACAAQTSCPTRGCPGRHPRRRLRTGTSGPRVRARSRRGTMGTETRGRSCVRWR